MTQIKQVAIEYELKRSMRPDWRRFWKPGHEDDPLYRFCESVERKYSPEQPRVPAGDPAGGQWTSGGGDGGSSSEGSNRSGARTNGNNPQTRIAARISQSRAEECEIIRRQDEFKCKALQMRSCYEQAYLRYSNCLSGRPIPPLFF